jgi:branched-chain amino acid transport system ATP-binding protein
MPTSATPEPVLTIRNLHVGYGKHQILRGLDLEMVQGEVLAVLGANGVGKSTLLNAISGFLKPSKGEILLNGVPITGAGPHRTFRRGIIQISQSRDLFPDMTVEANLRLGVIVYARATDVSAALEHVYQSFPRLFERRNQQARTLSGGEQQMLAIGRAVIGKPKILLLDEPSGGLSPQFVAEIGSITQSLKESGATMLIVEQNIALARRVGDRFLVLRDGRIAGSISGETLANPDDETVKNIYL